MKTILLTQGYVAFVDDADYEKVNAHKWHVRKIGKLFYAARSIKKPNGKRTRQYLHHFLMPGVFRIDHRNGDGLNNSRDKNLRPATHKQNLRGFRRSKLGTTSKFRGVCWYKRDQKWKAQITVDGKNKFLGTFDSDEKAAHAYDSAAVFYFGEWASTNFPIGDITIT